MPIVNTNNFIITNNICNSILSGDIITWNIIPHKHGKLYLLYEPSITIDIHGNEHHREWVIMKCIITEANATYIPHPSVSPEGVSCGSDVL